MSSKNIITFNEDDISSLIFQGNAYFVGNLIDYYRKENKFKNDFIEFLPGIFLACETVIKSKLFKLVFDRINKKREQNERNNSIIEYVILKYYSEKIIRFNFRNKRDDYFLIGVNDEILFENEKKYKGQELEHLVYENICAWDTEKPVFIEVDTEKILFPKSSGGDGKGRCTVKGTFQEKRIFSTHSSYSFFSEYEMHCAVKHFNKLNEICEECLPCTNTVKLMKAGEFKGPTEENNSDGLRLYEYRDFYIISNGNHRACAAKIFGVKKVKAEVYRKKSKDLSSVENYETENYEKRYNGQSNDNKKVLRSYYEVLAKNNINEDEARTLLELEDSNYKLIQMLF